VRGQRGDRERLLDILEAIEAVRTHITSRAQLDDPVPAAAASHWIEIIGEAVNGLSPGVRDGHPDVAWQDAIRMRNRLIHGYFDIDSTCCGTRSSATSRCSRLRSGRFSKPCPTESHRPAKTLGAGDENRTRVLSLGS
jgi:uncharacterized protein with HEPN domain